MFPMVRFQEHSTGLFDLKEDRKTSLVWVRLYEHSTDLFQ